MYGPVFCASSFFHTVFGIFVFIGELVQAPQPNFPASLHSTNTHAHSLCTDIVFYDASILCSLFFALVISQLFKVAN